MPFIYKKNLNPDGGRVLMAFTITDSQVLSEGEAVKLASGKVSTWGTGGAGLGIVVGFVKADGSPVTDNGAGGDYAGTYTAGSSNTVKAVVDVSRDSIYSVPLDAAPGTTTGSNLAGYNADLTAGSQTIDESTAGTGTASFFLLGEDTSEGAQTYAVLAKIQESELCL
jgi:hypothetical protein